MCLCDVCECLLHVRTFSQELSSCESGLNVHVASLGCISAEVKVAGTFRFGLRVLGLVCISTTNSRCFFKLIIFARVTLQSTRTLSKVARILRSQSAVETLVHNLWCFEIVLEGSVKCARACCASVDSAPLLHLMRVCE